MRRGKARCGCTFGEPERCDTSHVVSPGQFVTRVEISHATGELARMVYVHWTEYRAIARRC